MSLIQKMVSNVMTNISDLDVESDKIVNKFNQKLMFKYHLKFLKD
jgi:hypothetical protein